jgi:hypothetical protein
MLGRIGTAIHALLANLLLSRDLWDVEERACPLRFRVTRGLLHKRRSQVLVWSGLNFFGKDS